MGGGSALHLLGMLLLGIFAVSWGSERGRREAGAMQTQGFSMTLVTGASQV